MLTGALLLVPSKKDESLGVFFKKRFSRIGVPFLFWIGVYFFWTMFIEKQAVTQEYIVNGILQGPYVHFWYLYMLAGLYLLTPLLRVMVAQFTDKHFKYFIGLWFVGTILTSCVKFASGDYYHVDGNLFVIPLLVGYFVMGAYLVKLQIRRRILVALTGLGLSLTVMATYFAAYWRGYDMFFFQDPTSPTIILASAALFMLLNSYAKPKTLSQVEAAVVLEKNSWKRWILHIISENSLPIYLFHMIVLALISGGFFGYTLNGNSIDPSIGAPIIAVIVLGLSLLIIVPLKKISILKKLMG